MGILVLFGVFYLGSVGGCFIVLDLFVFGLFLMFYFVFVFW